MLQKAMVNVYENAKSDCCRQIHVREVKVPELARQVQEFNQIFRMVFQMIQGK